VHEAGSEESLGIETIAPVQRGVPWAGCPLQRSRSESKRRFLAASRRLARVCAEDLATDARLLGLSVFDAACKMIVPPGHGNETSTGVRRAVVDPSPSWPQLFRPQHQAEPSASTAQVCS